MMHKSPNSKSPSEYPLAGCKYPEEYTQPKRRSTLAGRWTTNLLLLLVTTVIALFLAEVAFRFFSNEEVQLHGLYSADLEIGYSLAPGFKGFMRTSEFEYEVHINSSGIRDVPITPKPMGVRRILALGDSFTFGVGVQVEFSYPKLLEKRLNEEQNGSRFQVFNAGTPGYSTLQELQILQRLIGPVSPDYVVLGFFVGDDFFGNRHRLTPEEVRKTWRGFLQVHSSLFRSLDRYINFASRARSYDIHRRNAPDDILARINKTLELVLKIQALCSETGAELLVILIPRYIQVYDYAWEKAVMFLRLSPEEYDLAEPNRRFATILRDKNIRTIDLLKPLREAAQVRPLNFEQDGHWNPEGNALVASIIAKAILDL